jgi:HK97 family phage major capsid protein
MSVEAKDVKEVADALNARFTEFKEKNDKRIDGIEAEKGKLSETVETLNGKLTELDDLKSNLEKEILALKRPGDVSGNKSTNEHKAAFGKFVRKGHDDGLQALEQKALGTTSDADGGFAVPEELDRNIIQLEHDMSPMRQVCNQISISTSDFKRLVNLGGAGSGWVGEAEERPATSTPKLAQIAATMGEIYANPQATQASLDDIFYNVEAWLSGEVAREFAEKEGSAFLMGDGSNKPKGILAHNLAVTADATRAFGTIQKVLSGTAGGFSADNLLSLIHSLKKAYRNGSQWMFAGTTLHQIRTFKDTQGNYLWVPGIQTGQASSIFGYGIAENEDMPAVGADTNAVMLGDFKRAYTIVDRTGTRILRDPFTNKPNVGFYTTKRVGGMLTDSNAVKVLTLSA